MLKKRLMGVVVVRDGIAVQSFQYNRYLPIGRPEIVVQALNSWGIDEIAVVDISASKKGQLNIDLVRKLSRYCRVPLTYGGGIQTADEMTEAVRAGADKVMLNRSFLARPELVTEGAERLGNQCVVVSIDLIKNQGVTHAYDYLAQNNRKENFLDLARKAEAVGAGEIFLNSVDRDGSKTGYDLESAQAVASAIYIPVTLCGGVGKPEHFAEGLRIENISAVAAANFFNFTEHSVTITKQFLIAQTGAALRHDTYFDYAGSSFADNGRLAKKQDAVLKEMLFEYHPKEVI